MFEYVKTFRGFGNVRTLDEFIAVLMFHLCVRLEIEELRGGLYRLNGAQHVRVMRFFEMMKKLEWNPVNLTKATKESGNFDP